MSASTLWSASHLITTPNPNGSILNLNMNVKQIFDNFIKILIFSAKFLSRYFAIS
jgi:hypothetical protein